MKYHTVTGFAFVGAMLGACDAPVTPAETIDVVAPPDLRGAWTVETVRLEAGPQAGSHTLDVQPAMFIFNDTHYSTVAVTGFAARGYLAEDPPLEELGRAYLPFRGHAGTYALEGDELRLSPDVAKDPALMMDGTHIDYGLTWDEQTAVLTTQTPDAGQIMLRLARLPEDDMELSPTMQRFQGAWHRSERILGTGDSAEHHIADMQPGYYIFHGDKFAANFVTTFEPRPQLSEAPTDEEYGEVFGGYASFAGRFSIDGDEVILWPLVSLNPNNMRGRPFQPFQMEWDDQGVWFVYPGDGGVEYRTRLTPVGGASDLQANDQS